MSTDYFKERPAAPEGEKREWTLLHRGVWAQHLADGDLLPVGGSIFSDKLTLHLQLDFSSFDKEVEKFNEENLRTLFAPRREAVEKWLAESCPEVKVDPYTWFVCLNLQSKLHRLLQVTTEDIDTDRTKAYREDKPPTLSELRGRTMCGERAAMAQYLLQRAGLKSAYVGGVEMADAKDPGQDPTMHSYVVVEDPADPALTYVYDVARPHNQHDLPRLLKTDVPMTSELLAGKSDLFVRAKDVLRGGDTLWYGVGDPSVMRDGHETIETKDTSI